MSEALVFTDKRVPAGIETSVIVEGISDAATNSELDSRVSNVAISVSFPAEPVAIDKVTSVLVPLVNANDGKAMIASYA